MKEIQYNVKFRGGFDVKFKNKSQAKKIKKEIDSLGISWTIEDDQLKWDGSHMCVNYLQHLHDVLTNIFKRNHIEISGEVRWMGEDMGDSGVISIEDGRVLFNGKSIPLEGAENAL